VSAFCTRVVASLVRGGPNLESDVPVYLAQSRTGQYGTPNKNSMKLYSRSLSSTLIVTSRGDLKKRRSPTWKEITADNIREKMVVNKPKARTME
jgi:hypothetical protein